MKIVTVSEMQAIEHAAEAAGHSYAAMMERAGQGLAEIVEAEYGDRSGRRLAALIGKGNNGGDTLIALEYLAKWGWSGIFLIVDRPDDELVRRAEDAGWVRIDRPGSIWPDLARQISSADVLLDGVLGTGIRLPLRPPASDLLRAVKDALPETVRVVAVDTPSGVDCDHGEAAQETLRADLTITMAAAKTGFYHFPAAKSIGSLRLAGIGIPPDLPEWTAVRREALAAEQVRAWLPDRPADAHKGTFGTVWIAAGSVRFPGAVLLAARAAFRSGAGLVATAPPESVYPIVAGHFPESTWLPLPEEEGGHSGDGAGVLLKALDRADALLLGPGFGRAAAARAFVEQILQASPRLPALVVDADALQLAAELENWPERLPAATILTPHPGEMAALTGLEVRVIQTDRIRIAEQHAAEWGHIVVLKGAFTVIAAPDGRTAVVPISTPALARAGTGDVLAGLIAGLRAQGLPPFEAAAAGAWIHARAGVRAAEFVGDPAAVIASDVLEGIAAVLREIRHFRN